MNGVSTWGQLAALILILYLFLAILMTLVLSAALMFILAGLREQAEHLRRLRPAISRLNHALVLAQRGEPLPPEFIDHQLIQIVSQIPRVTATLPAKASAVEQKVVQGSDRVAHTVIELRARTEMIKGMAKAFFLPGLTRTRRVTLPQTVAEHKLEPVGEQQEGTIKPLPYEEMVMVQRMR